MSDESKPVPTLTCIAWCPDDCDADEAREYAGNTPGDIAEQHAEWMYGQGDPRESYDIHVRATKGDVVREWSVCVDVEIEMSFNASLAFPLSTRRKPAEPAPTATDAPHSSSDHDAHGGKYLEPFDRGRR